MFACLPAYICVTVAGTWGHRNKGGDGSRYDAREVSCTTSITHVPGQLNSVLLVLTVKLVVDVVMPNLYCP
jgi:hypothetical protein